MPLEVLGCPQALAKASRRGWGPAGGVQPHGVPRGPAGARRLVGASREAGRGGHRRRPAADTPDNSLHGIRPKPEHLSHRRPHDAGAGEARSGTAPRVPAAEVESPECQLKTENESINPGLLLLKLVRQVRDQWGRGPALAPPLRDSYPLGGVASGPLCLQWASGARGPAPAYKSGAAVQLAHFSLRPVARTLRETHRPDSPW